MYYIIHIDTAKTWRGGQQQVAYLHEGLIDKGIKSLVVCPPESRLKKWCVDHQLPYTSLPLKGEYDLYSAYQLAKIIPQKNKTILHAHDAHALMIALWVDVFAKKTPSIVASRRVDFPLKGNKIRQLKYQTPRLDKIICISQAILRIMQAHDIPDDKLTVIPSGIDIHKFDAISRDKTFWDTFGIPQNHRIVSTVAALTGHKDYPNLLEAAAVVLQKYPAVTFVIVGNGEQADAIHALTEGKGLKDHVIFTGFRTDVGYFLKNSDLFVLPSKKEGMGTSILDAEAAGLPVIGTDAGGIPEVIRHEQNGLIVPKQNPEALANAILSLLENDKKRQAFGQKSLDVVRDFDIKLTIKKHITLYETILK
ncbi:MAG: glycosyltransferase family 4 protein [Candidatus Marinimicrobia bacterium]|nr:glycosyltransferase family 4 protein [Candidatus Neomarinimicrobiota bacterium]MDD5582147.1 glycosyltransferase family 4 protein [Candidatus Neomarinimicrobiota bacterium]